MRAQVLYRFEQDSVRILRCISASIVLARGIRTFPDIFVLEGEGVFQFRKVRDEELDDSLKKLMAETETP